jgi:hypothetical protein
MAEILGWATPLSDKRQTGGFASLRRRRFAVDHDCILDRKYKYVNYFYRLFD